ncbi:hypothetical protein DSECCO2_176680 [anaerobic digester metagenome]
MVRFCKPEYRIRSFQESVDPVQPVGQFDLFQDFLVLLLSKGLLPADSQPVVLQLPADSQPVALPLPVDLLPADSRPVVLQQLVDHLPVDLLPVDSRPVVLQQLVDHLPVVLQLPVVLLPEVLPQLGGLLPEEAPVQSVVRQEGLPLREVPHLRELLHLQAGFPLRALARQV